MPRLPQAARTTGQWASARAAQVRRAVAAFKGTRLGRTLERYSKRHGGVLAGGIAYHALMSVAAGLVVVSTLAAVVIDRLPRVRAALVDFLERIIPGVITTGDGDGLINPAALTVSPVTGMVSLVAFVVVLNTATRYVSSLRPATRTMLGTTTSGAVGGKLRDFAALGLLMALAVGGALVQILAVTASAWVGVDTGNVVTVRLITLAVTLLVDTGFVITVLVVLGKASQPWRSIAVVAIGAAVVIGVLRAASSLLLSSAAGNPILAPFAAVVTLLVWVDLVARVVLIAAAWLGAESSSNDRPERGASI